jgi:hemerythrin
MGVQELDQDHKRLLRIPELIVERLDSAEVMPKQGPFLVREGLQYMAGFCQSHFEREEAYMRQINYPHYEAHKRYHDEMVQTSNRYLPSLANPDSEEIDQEYVLKVLGATYGWQMIHIAMEDMAIVGKGATAQPKETSITDAAIIRELNYMMKSLLNFNARTKILDHDYQGDRLYSAVCQKLRYQVGDRDVTILLGGERMFVRFAAETFWPDKHLEGKLDKAHLTLLQWCLTAFAVGFWRNLVGRFSYDEPFILQEVYPLAAKDVRKAIRGMDYRRSTLYETTRGRFFMTSCF